jgi:hypothetical protein
MAWRFPLIALAGAGGSWRADFKCPDGHVQPPATCSYLLNSLLALMAAVWRKNSFGTRCHILPFVIEYVVGVGSLSLGACFGLVLRA